MEQQIIDRLREIITPYAKDQNALNCLNRNSDFINDLKINSANLVDIVLDVEEAFNIEIDNEAMEQMLSVGAAVDIINGKLASQ